MTIVAWMTEDGRVATDETKRAALSRVAQASFYIGLALESEVQLLQRRVEAAETAGWNMRSEITLLRGQLAARDAALDTVHNMAHNDPNAMCDSPGETALRRKLANLLTSHGIHK